MEAAVEILQSGRAKGRERKGVERKERKAVLFLQDFASKGQNVDYYTKAKANQRRKEWRVT